MAIKLYPPQLEGTLPAFYKKYEVDPTDIDKKILKGASIPLPFGMNRLVNETQVNGISCRVRTIATNTYLIVKDIDKSLIDFTNGIAYLRLNETEADKLKEGQYYKIQLAYIGTNGTVGYYSSVGIIKCVAKPTVEIHGFSTDTTNQLNNELIGVYTQDYSFGDSTEKVYSYNFIIWNDKNEILDQTEEVVHDSTQDVSSFSSRDIFKTYKTLPDGVVGSVQYTITTMNKLVMSSPKYQVMKAATIEMETPLKLSATTNYDNGYIQLNLEGQTIGDSIDLIHEAICSGTFVIYRASDQDDYIEHEEITRFVIDAGYPSSYYFRDYTVQQGINYRYYIQQYNINKVYSNEIQSLNRRLDDPYNLYDEPTKADFEDMFLYDGYRQLKIRFNPKVDSFKNSIPEQKIETIGSKYPFIFRNGNVCYKEFPIAGLVSFQMDESTLFLNKEELKQANILEKDQFRIATNAYEDLSHKSWVHEQNYEFPTEKIPIEDPLLPGVIVGYKTIYHRQPCPENPDFIKYDTASENNFDNTGWNDYTDIIRSNRDLTTENMMSERYFKLKVLDWLTDGKVKLFRSPGEGNYLVRLLNVSMKPKDPLGRMLHDFTCTGYEIAALTYNNLVYYNIVHNNTPNIMEMHWSSIDLRDIQYNNHFYDPDGWLMIPIGDAAIQSFQLTNFVPGDKIRIHFSDDIEDNALIFTIGPTGTFNYDYDDRIICGIEMLLIDEPYKDFDRNIIYQYPGLLLTKFDTISDIKLHTQIAEEFVGPKENLLDHYNLIELISNNELSHDNMVDELYNNIRNKDNINYYLNKDIKFTLQSLDLIKVRKRPLIPIYACSDLIMDYYELRSYSQYDSNMTYYKKVSGEYEEYTYNPDTWEQDKLSLYGRMYRPTESSQYNVTSFGIGYVNNKIITVEDNGNFETIETTSVIPVNGKINTIEIKEVVKYINSATGRSFSPYQQTDTILRYDFAVLQLFVPQLKDGRYIWVPCERNYWRYYDTYYAKWWNNIEYDPSFCVNDTDIQCQVKKAQMYNSNTEKYEPTYIVTDLDLSRRNSEQMPVLNADVLERAYENYKYDHSGYELLDNNAIYNEKNLYFIFNNESDKFIPYTTYSQSDWENKINNRQLYILNDKTNWISVDNIDEITLYRLGKVDKISLGSGVMAEVTAQLQVVDYLIEDTDARVKEMKMGYKGIDAAGNSVGEYANFQAALHGYMTKAQQIEDARDKLSELNTRLESLYEQKEQYEQERGSVKKNTGIPQFLKTLKSMIDSYHDRLFINIQGVKSVVIDSQVEELMPQSLDVLTFNTQTYINKAENQNAWINIPLDMMEFEKVEIYSAQSDQIRLTLISRDEENNIIPYIDENNNNTIKITIGQSGHKIYTAPYGLIITKIEIKKSNNEPIYDRKIIATNYHKRIGQIGAFLSTAYYPSTNGNQRFWPDEGIEIETGIIYKYDKINNKVIVEYANGQQDIYDNRTLRYADNHVPNFVTEDSVNNTISLIKDENGNNLIDIYKNQTLNYIGKDKAEEGTSVGNYYKVLNIYKSILDKSYESVERMSGILSILLNAGLADAQGKILYSKYVPWLINQIVGEENGVIWQIYNYLHYYSALEEDLYTGDPMDPTTWKPLTWEQYKELLFLGNKNNNEDWYHEKLGYKYEVSNNSNGFIDTIKDEVTTHINEYPNETLDDFKIFLNNNLNLESNNIYIDNEVNGSINITPTDLITAKHFQGSLVEEYENILVYEKNYIDLYKEYLILDKNKNLIFSENIITQWNDLIRKLEDAQKELNKYKMWLENKDLIDDTALQENIINNSQSMDIDNYLQMKIIETQGLIDQYNRSIEQQTIIVDDIVYYYSDYQKYKIQLEQLQNKIENEVREFNDAIDLYGQNLIAYIQLIILIRANTNFRQTMSLKELLDKYDSVRDGNYNENESIPDASVEVQTYNKNYQVYSDHILQLKNYGKSTTTPYGVTIKNPTTVRKYIDKIKEYLKIYTDTIGLYEIYYNNIIDIDAQILDVREQIRLQTQIINNSGQATTSFDDSTWMAKIQKALAKYLVTLAEVYKEKVEDRYNL